MDQDLWRLTTKIYRADVLVQSEGWQAVIEPGRAD